jgi:hypothetical protein
MKLQQEPWTESQNTMNIWHKPTHEPISNLNSKVLVCRRICLKWYADEYHKQKKNNVDYTPQDKPALETKKMVQISSKLK